MMRQLCDGWSPGTEGSVKLAKEKYESSANDQNCNRVPKQTCPRRLHRDILCRESLRRPKDKEECP